jgi:dUTP pyrophosphatase
MSYTLYVKLFRDENTIIPHISDNRGDAGIDLFCQYDSRVLCGAMGVKYRLGIACQLIDDDTNMPMPYWLVVRSSTGAKTKLRQSNAPGVIDAGYTGELIWLIDHLGTHDYTIQRGDRLVQIVPMVWKPIVSVFPVNDFAVLTTRGVRGLGSTGT